MKDTFTAVPSHLYYIMKELLKNSCRATVLHGLARHPGEELPPVKVTWERETAHLGMHVRVPD